MDSGGGAGRAQGRRPTFNECDIRESQTTELPLGNGSYEQRHQTYRRQEGKHELQA